MPYLKQERKDKLAGNPIPETPGDLNYLVTLELLKITKNAAVWGVPSKTDKLVQAYIEENGKSYTTYSNAIGALTCAGAEYQRRTPEHLWVDTHREVLRRLNEYIRQFYNETVAPYEDEKIEENGDVYP